MNEILNQQIELLQNKEKFNLVEIEKIKKKIDYINLYDHQINQIRILKNVVITMGICGITSFLMIFVGNTLLSTYFTFGFIGLSGFSEIGIKSIKNDLRQNYQDLLNMTNDEISNLKSTLNQQIEKIYNNNISIKNAINKCKLFLDYKNIDNDNLEQFIQEINTDIIEDQENILKKDYKTPKITEKTIQEIKNYPELYTDSSINTQLGKIYLDERFEQHSDEIMNQELPVQEKGPILKKTRKINN